MVNARVVLIALQAAFVMGELFSLPSAVVAGSPAEPQQTRSSISTENSSDVLPHVADACLS
jgi:hypothetical protein